MQRGKVSTLDGAVTLQNSAREKSADASGSRRNDNLTPRLRRRHAKIAVGSCRSEMTLDVEDTMGRGEDKAPHHRRLSAAYKVAARRHAPYSELPSDRFDRR
ncbi:MAG: hypothetical protein CR217_11860 [Beijerinckiaceae bacterium]|nr:MAG: hypothetical protein CR217_11860 [Beijerinckiaceae bacterium]